MRHTMWTLVLMITVGMLGFTAGMYAQPNSEPQLVTLLENAQPHVMLAGSGTREQKQARQQNEGCAVVPPGEPGQQKSNEKESSIMKGLVF